MSSDLSALVHGSLRNLVGAEQDLEMIETDIVDGSVLDALDHDSEDEEYDDVEKTVCDIIHQRRMSLVYLQHELKETTDFHARAAIERLIESKKSMPSYEEMLVIERQAQKRKLKESSSRDMETGIKANLDAVDPREPNPSAWIFDPSIRPPFMDPRASAHKLIRSHTDWDQMERPLPGLFTTVTCPADMSEIKIPAWALVAPELITTNVVATFNLGCKFNLVHLTSQMMNVSFNPTCFAAANMRYMVTCLIYASGRVVCPGSVSTESARRAAQNCATQLQRHTINVTVSNLTVQNVVSTATAGFGVDLNRLATEYSDCTQYTPRFPGLTFRWIGMQVVFIVFMSGSCIITGVPTHEQSRIAWVWFWSCVLWNFRKQSSLSNETEEIYRHRQRTENSIIKGLCLATRNMIVQHLHKKYKAALTEDDIDDTEAHREIMMAIADTGQLAKASDADAPTFGEWLREDTGLDMYSDDELMEDEFDAIDLFGANDTFESSTLFGADDEGLFT